MLTAKAIVFFLVAFVITTGRRPSLVALRRRRHAGRCQDAERPASGCRRTVGIALYVALLGLLSLAIGSLIRHSAGAITIDDRPGAAAAGASALFMFAQSLADLRADAVRVLDPEPAQRRSTTTPSPTSGPTGWDPLWIALGVTAAAFAGAYALLEKRDV